MVSLTAGAMGVLLVLTTWGGTPQPVSSCTAACSKAKSEAYQRCRTIPPSQRAKRVDCFNKADKQLKRCLRDCK